MDRERAKEYAKDQLENYLHLKGINTNKNFSCICPGHEDKKPSMGYKDNAVTCFGCGFHGDIFDVIGVEYGLTDDKEKFNKTYEVLGISLDSDYSNFTDDISDNLEYDRGGQKSPGLAEDTEEYKVIAKYLNSRGISKKAIEKHNLSYAEYGNFKMLKIPVTKDNSIYRNIDPYADSKDRYRKTKGQTSSLYNTSTIKDKDVIIVVEGELDAISLLDIDIESRGATAIGLGSISNKDKLIKYLNINNINKDIILMLDNDIKGIETALYLEEKLKEMGLLVLYDKELLGEYKDPNEALKNNREQLQKNVIDAIENRSKYANAKELKEHNENTAKAHIKDFLNDIKNSVNTEYTSTGYKLLDNVLDGGLYEGLYILGAISSLGKTTFTLQMADQIAEQGKDVLIFSLEMSRAELMAKSISRETAKVGIEKKLDIGNYKTNRDITTYKRYKYYSDTEKQLIRDAIKKYSEYSDHLYIYEGIGDIGVKQIKNTIDKHIRLTGNTPIVIIDYLQILAPYSDRASDKQNTDKAVLELKRMSRDYKTTIFAISSFNRDSYTSEVSKKSFKESGAIEYSSDVLIGLQFYGMKIGANKGEEKENIETVNTAMKEDIRSIEVKILKNRNGKTGTSTLLKYYSKFNYLTQYTK